MTSMSAAIYIRVSTAGQEDNYSPKTQEDACRTYCQQQGYVVVEEHVYREVFSGAALYERPELTRLRQAIAQRQVQAVVCFSLDRLSRKQTHVALLVDELERADCRLLFVTEDFEDGPVGTFIRQAKAFAAELERERIKERTRRGLLARVKSGKPRPGCRAPYGYQWRDEEKSGFKVDPDTTPVVQWIFEAMAGGQTLRGITAELNERGVPSPSGRPLWGYTTISVIVSNPIYVGRAAAFRTVRTKNSKGRPTTRLRPVEEQISLPEGTAPPIIDKATFETIQARLRLNEERATRSARDPEAALLRAGYVRCGYCGGTMPASRSGKGGKYISYRCGRVRETGRQCEGTSIPAAALDQAVWSRISSVLMNPSVIGAQVDKMRQDDPTEADLARIDRLIAQSERQRANLVAHLAKLDPESADLIYSQLEMLNSKRKGLVEERDAVARRRAAWELAQDRLDQLEAWCRTVAANVEDMSYQQKRLSLDALGVTTRVYKAGHEPRYEIEANIPMSEVALAFNTH